MRRSSHLYQPAAYHHTIMPHKMYPIQPSGFYPYNFTTRQPQNKHHTRTHKHTHVQHHLNKMIIHSIHSYFLTLFLSLFLFVAPMVIPFGMLMALRLLLLLFVRPNIPYSHFLCRIVRHRFSFSADVVVIETPLLQFSILSQLIYSFLGNDGGYGAYLNEVTTFREANINRFIANFLSFK